MTTFVTAYLKVYEQEYDDSRTFENRLNHFIRLLDSGINICIFIDPCFKDKFSELEVNYKNLKVIREISIHELEMYQIGQQMPELCQLPDNRNTLKDTKNYMYVILAKLEFIKKAIDVNPYNTTYFCWLDFSLPYIFKHMDETLLKIKNISMATFKDEFIYIPGCWDSKVSNLDYLTNNIVWRFCGGVLIGDKRSLTRFYNVSNDNFLHFLKLTNKLVWEVNYWAWLESSDLISPTWGLADHNDSIVDIPLN